MSNPVYGERADQHRLHPEGGVIGTDALVKQQFAVAPFTGATAPTDVYVGQLWVDTTSTDGPRVGTLKRWNGAAWEIIAPPLTVKEADGDPIVVGVTTIQVDQTTGLSVTDDGGNEVTIKGTPLTVEEVDGSPSVSNVNKIRFNQAAGLSVTDDGGGQVTISDTGSGSGAYSVERKMTGPGESIGSIYFQSINNNSDTLINLTLLTDSFLESSGAGLLDGVYIIVARVAWDTNSTGARKLTVIFNGSTTNTTGALPIGIDIQGAVDGLPTINEVTTVWPIRWSLGESITLKAYQNSGSPLYLLMDAPDFINPHYPELSFVYVAPWTEAAINVADEPG